MYTLDWEVYDIGDSTLEIILLWEAEERAAVEVGGIQPLQVWKYVYDPP